MTGWNPDKEYIEFLKQCILENKFIPPLIVVKEKEDYLIVNGHHRCRAFMEMEKKQIKCIVIEGTFEESEPLRKAEVLLKEFDRKTDYRYRFSGYLDRWAALAENRNYINTYRPTLGFLLYRWFNAIKNRLKK
jgi:hypothetical protein